MKTIQFSRTVQYATEGRNRGPIYTEGSVHTFEDSFADKWLGRGVAVEVAGGVPIPEPAVDPAPADAPADPAPAEEPTTSKKARRDAKHSDSNDSGG